MGGERGRGDGEEGGVVEGLESSPRPTCHNGTGW